MRLLLFLWGACLFTPVITAQKITGNITDTNGKPIEYVSVGLANTTVGVISDGSGYFSLAIPDSLAGSEVIFSHISYDPLRVPAQDLLAKVLSGGEMNIRLCERSLLMQEVTVHSGKARYKRVGSSHLSAFRRAFFYARPRRHAIDPQELAAIGPDTIPESEFNGELLSKLDIRQPLVIREISFPVSRMTHDSLLLRFNFYKKQDGEFIPLHRIPVYAMISRTTEPLYHDVDILDEEIVALPGRIYIGLEIVRYFGFRKDGVLELPFHPGEGYRRAGIDRFESVPGHGGIQIYGRILPD